jgi:predicted site-specific integrase-resolvase
MASKRKFKKELNYMVFDVVEECFSVQLYNVKKTDVTNKLIDEVIEFRNSMTAKIHKAKSKKDFPSLNNEVEDAAVDFIHKINELH